MIFWHVVTKFNIYATAGAGLLILQYLQNLRFYVHNFSSSHCEICDIFTLLYNVNTPSIAGLRILQSLAFSAAIIVQHKQTAKDDKHLSHCSLWGDKAR